MPETSRFFDGTQGDARTYSAADFAEYFATMVTNGVWAEELDALELYSTDTNMASTLKAGRAFISGHYYESDTTMPLTHDAADATYNRIDRVVLRLDLNAEARNIKATVLKGTPAETPTAPALTQDSIVYEIPIAQVLIPAASGVVLDANITDERQYARYKTKPEWYPEGSVPQEAYMYQLFKNELTAQEISDIEANPSLMAIISGNPVEAYYLRGAYPSINAALGTSDILLPTQKAVKTYVDSRRSIANGYYTSTISFTGGTYYTITKTIPIGNSYGRYGEAIIGRSSFSLKTSFGTDLNQGVGALSYYNGTKFFSYEATSYLSDSDFFNTTDNRFYVKSIVIDGSDLKVTFYGYGNGTVYDIKIAWKVFG